MIMMYSYCNFSLCSQGRVEKYVFTVELDETEYRSEIEMNEANEFIAWSDGMSFIIYITWYVTIHLLLSFFLNKIIYFSRQIFRWQQPYDGRQQYQHYCFSSFWYYFNDISTIHWFTNYYYEWNSKWANHDDPLNDC